ncbi:putative tyrosinase-like protein tyr-3 [Dreissena polymorpha]|uniref:putative tyrosinase-like protein tyr-3 n=1 Tax=Dreissena polymorpha TaxID=45954 RepID=UPI002264CD9A|nr:putative tyrosinase-like protein tyr-3 [Dreissena polymorpha]
MRKRYQPQVIQKRSRVIIKEGTGVAVVEEEERVHRKKNLNPVGVDGRMLRCRSSECLGLQEGLEASYYYYYRKMVEDMIEHPSKTIPLVAYIDNKSVIEALSPSKLVDDTRLRVDIAAIRESMERNDVSDIKCFRKNPPVSGYRVRRDIRVLSVTERQKLFRAFNILCTTGVLALFGRIHGQQVLRKHHGASFLRWHRVFLAAVEEKLREIDPDVSLAYWDYTMNYLLPLPSDSVIWSSCFAGNGNGVVSEGPFRFMYGGFNELIRRDIARHGTCPPRLINKDDIDQLMRFCYYANITTGNPPNYYQQVNNLEVLHDGVHNWVGGDMSYVRHAP